MVASKSRIPLRFIRATLAVAQRNPGIKNNIQCHTKKAPPRRGFGFEDSRIPLRFIRATLASGLRSALSRSVPRKDGTCNIDGAG